MGFLQREEAARAALREANLYAWGVLGHSCVFTIADAPLRASPGSRARGVRDEVVDSEAGVFFGVQRVIDEDVRVWVPSIVTPCDVQDTNLVSALESQSLEICFQNVGDAREDEGLENAWKLGASVLLYRGGEDDLVERVGSQICAGILMGLSLQDGLR